MTIDFKALAAKAAAAGADQTQAKAGGGERSLPAAGPGLCRLIGYIETGKQVKTFQGKPTVYDEVTLVFELVGKRHPPVELEDGTKLPHRITVRERLSLNEKANYFKLFQRLNYRQDVQHMAALLGEGFKCEVVHDKWTGKDGKERTDVVLRNAAGYTLAPPRKEDEDSETGWVDVAVPPALSEIRCFLWDHADDAQWASLYIEGSYPERKNEKGEVIAAKSKNVLQNRVLGAKNFEGSPIHALLVSKGVKLDLPAVGEDDEEDGHPAPTAPATPPAATPAADALGGIV
jgi:hypothetical protein